MPVEFRDISVIVQGPIFKSESQDPSGGLTYECLASIRKYLPGAEIILSTWEGENTEGLIADKILYNIDPGPVYKKDKLNILGRNINRQIVSTKCGIRNASKKYCIKFRADAVLTGNGFLKYFKKYNNYDPSWRLFSDRVIISSQFTRNPNSLYPFPYHYSDVFLMGNTDDLTKIWDIDLVTENESLEFKNERPINDMYPESRHRLIAEQYIYTNLLKRFGNISFKYYNDLNCNNIKMSELILANNFVVLNPSQISMRIEFDTNFKDWISLYDYYEWLLLYKQYCNDDTVSNRELLIGRSLKELKMTYVNLHKTKMKIRSFRRRIKYSIIDFFK